MGVATRGVKFKFSSGERVLCYEPDPTKAKVLYESKVLDLVVSRDDRGRKIPEYLIHFLGWNSSWDRCVREEFILPFTEENCELQTKLAIDAALSIKGKRKLPPLIKETLNKKSCTDSENEKSDETNIGESSSETESSEDEVEKEVNIDIPGDLKQQLEEDCRLITNCFKLVKLPCQPNVIAILEGFVKHSAAKLLCASPPKNSNNRKLMPEDVQNKLNLCKEAVDGLRIYFDFTLPHLLLYRQEKKQYYSEAATCKPMNTATRDFHENKQTLLLKKEGENAISEVKKETETIRPHRLKNANVKLIPKSESNTNQIKIATKEGIIRKRGRPPKKTNIHSLRSKNIQPTKCPKKHPSTSLEPGPSTVSNLRLTRKATMAPPPLPDKPIPAISTVSSSNSSTHSSSLSCPLLLGQQLHLVNHLQDILSWKLCPTEMYEQVPVAPSMIYGAQHLLRLFVKLPHLILATNMANRKLQPLVSILQSFLMYMQEEKAQFFLSMAYVESKEDFHESPK